MEAANHYADLSRAAHHSCPRCEGHGETQPVSGRALPCARCFGTGEDLVGTLASWEADLQDLRHEWKYYNGLAMKATSNGKRFGLTKKLNALASRGQELKTHIASLKAEINSHLAPAPF